MKTPKKKTRKFPKIGRLPGRPSTLIRLDAPARHRLGEGGAMSTQDTILRVSVVCEALSYLAENADDGGVPFSDVVKKFDLSDEENDCLRELYANLESWLVWAARKQEG